MLIDGRAAGREVGGARGDPAARYPQPMCVSVCPQLAGTGVVTRGWASLGKAKGRSQGGEGKPLLPSKINSQLIAPVGKPPLSHLYFEV